jgi:hypothetical protein
MNQLPGDLQQMFKGYGEFHTELEPSRDFMPRLWAKIEARRSPWFAMKRMAHLTVATALAAALIMGAVLIPLMESKHPGGFYADVVAHDDTKADQEYAASLPLPGLEAPRR